jgi:hypothetical protein
MKGRAVRPASSALRPAAAPSQPSPYCCGVAMAVAAAARSAAVLQGPRLPPGAGGATVDSSPDASSWSIVPTISVKLQKRGGEGGRQAGRRGGR